MRRSRITVAGFALAAALALAGCGGGGGGDGGGASAARDASTVRTSDSPLGDILVDGGGRTLYLFTEDGENTNSMECDAACLELWPPMEGKPEAGAGADAGLIGTTKGDGEAQATYAGHPLYYYAPDRNEGDLKGQGIDGVWYVLDAEGRAVTDAVPSPDDDGTGGYGY
ncbi:COG4315 family predicted lipoprotein [Streptomyces blattellae]|uniref:COG4315 family predicted lipoprotein n=1 Tax=Streptomyces blattellae TaxID=2569855 RepID=UPI0012B834D3|nr:hypothetical protein [Streptomyces blattellae]